jgi:dephospho-CoA kinase
MIGSGKSYVSKLISDTYGYHYINTDKLFKNVFNLGAYRCAMDAFAETNKIKPFKNDQYDSKYMFTRLFNEEECLTDFSLVKKLNEMNSMFLYGELLHHLTTENISPDRTIILEMATLPVSKFSQLCKKIVKVQRDVTITDILARDPGRDYMATTCLMVYQKSCFLDKIDTIVNDGCSDEELLEQFRSICESYTF